MALPSLDAPYLQERWPQHRQGLCHESGRPHPLSGTTGGQMDTKTDRAMYGFIVKEFPDGTPWLVLEPMDGRNIPAAGNGFFGLDLKAGVTYAQALQLAEIMNRQVDGLSHTWDLPKHL